MTAHVDLKERFDCDENLGKDPLSYDNINRCEGGKLLILCRNYQIFQSVYFEEDYIFFKNINPSPFVLPEMKNYSQGYKLHITIDASNENDANFKKGWIIVRDVLIKHQIYFCKIIKNSSRAALQTNCKLSGNVVTIYAFKERRDDWEVIIQELTSALEMHGIRAGALSVFNTPVAGSKYISYSNDGRGGGADNPFKNIKIVG